MKIQKKVLLVVMDGVGINKSNFGNALYWAKTPTLDFLRKNSCYTELYTHGEHVGLNAGDMGNSEVGHNTMGAGRIYPQGAKLVAQGFVDKSIFKTSCWQSLLKSKVLHFIGLLSDGNVHSHEQHLHQMLEQAVAENKTTIRLHLLFDGRDVSPHSAEVYLERLRKVMSKLNDQGADIKIASGGGRMRITMDRYRADAKMLARGWDTHVLGKGPQVDTPEEALASFRKTHPQESDQYIPEFVVCEKAEPVAKIRNGDAVLLFNFRGDRALELSAAFEKRDRDFFAPDYVPDVFFAGMLEYDADLKIPNNFLLKPSVIENTFSEFLAKQKVRQFACSETQKFGHVTYFWNGNRSGYFDKSCEEYLKIPSFAGNFLDNPQMRVKEITDATLEKITSKSFDFARINFANPDMIGHTGDLLAAIKSLEAMDQQLRRLLDSCQEHDLTLMVTADHGNCEQMFLADPKDYPNWDLSSQEKIPAKTSHTTNPVPFYLYNHAQDGLTKKKGQLGLANIANTVLLALGFKEQNQFAPSLFS
jgi:2,3-bisphosphoglycerate-independent phosphoglycerate mutase